MDLGEFFVHYQLTLPISIQSLIPEDHEVRVVNKAIDQMDLKGMICSVLGGGNTFVLFEDSGEIATRIKTGSSGNLVNCCS